jgi:hypothetical protein
VCKCNISDLAVVFAYIAGEIITMHIEGMSRSLLNIEKRTLPSLMLRGVGLASKDAVV